MKLDAPKPGRPTKEEIQHHLLQSELEILVEGIITDGPTSATMQAPEKKKRKRIPVQKKYEIVQEVLRNNVALFNRKMDNAEG